MRTADSSSPSPSPRSSLRTWLNLGSPSICKSVTVSPSLQSSASSPSASRQSSFRLLSLPSLASGRLSFRRDNEGSRSAKETSKQIKEAQLTRDGREAPQSRETPSAPTPPLPPRKGSISALTISSSIRVAQLKSSIANSKLLHSQVAAQAKGSAAGGYALALAELSESLGILPKVSQDVENLNRLLEHEELVDFFKNNNVADEKKKSLLKTLAEDGNFQDHTVTFLNVLVDKKRVGILKEILTEFENINDDLNDTEVAIVTSASKMEKFQLQVIANKIQGLTGVKNIRMKNEVDDSLMAGYVVRYGKDGSRVLDMSVKGQLDRLATRFEPRSPAPRSDGGVYFPREP